MKIQLQQTICKLNEGKKTGKLFINIPYTKLNNNFCTLLYTYKLIENFIKFKYNNKLFLIIIYNNIQFTLNTFLNKQIYISYYNLNKYIYKYKYIFIFTSKGLCTGTLARLKGIGGSLICTI